MLVDIFKGYSTDIVKEYVKSFESGEDTDNKEDCYNLIDFYVIGRGATPKAQPLDLFLDKMIKGFHRDSHDIYVIDVPANPTAGHSFIPSHKLCATWIVSA